MGTASMRMSKGTEYSLTGLDLLRSVGGELKLPLVQIANAASLLAAGEYSQKEAIEQYNMLEDRTRRMLQIVDSLLFAGQVENNQTRLNLEPTNIANVAYGVMNEFNSDARSHSKQMILKPSRELVPAAVDVIALRHSMRGLLDMLLRSSGSQTLEILVHNQGDNVVITLRDEGPAISLKQIQQALKWLGKAAAPLKQMPTSTGMAFYVAYSLLHAMGGDLKISQINGARNLLMQVPRSRQLELV